MNSKIKIEDKEFIQEVDCNDIDLNLFKNVEYNQILINSVFKDLGILKPAWEIYIEKIARNKRIWTIIQQVLNFKLVSTFILHMVENINVFLKN